MLKNVSVLFNEPKLLKSTTEYHCSSPESNVSVLFNEPKLLKFVGHRVSLVRQSGFSALQRAEIAEIDFDDAPSPYDASFSALQRAEIAEMVRNRADHRRRREVSVLFNEPKLLKFFEQQRGGSIRLVGFSALQRAEIAEMAASGARCSASTESFSALQRAEIAEIDRDTQHQTNTLICFSALQRAEIAEIRPEHKPNNH